MKFHAFMIGAAAMAFAASAFAQDAPMTPAPGSQPATPMPPPATAQPSTPPANEPSATPPSQPDTSMAKPDPAANASYGMGWDARKCAAAEQKGKADPANCPKPEPKG